MSRPTIAEWRVRPADERLPSLTALRARCDHLRQTSRAAVVANRNVTVAPGAWDRVATGHDDAQERIGAAGAAEARFVQSNLGTGLAVVGPTGAAYRPTHHAFNQLAALAGATAGYLRKLPPALAADCMNYGLHVMRDVEEIGLLLQRNGDSTLRAATGPNYGRIWDAEIAAVLHEEFGDGGGRWGGPQGSSELYSSDRDMFAFLIDRAEPVEVPGIGRGGSTELLFHGVMAWNSEVGSASLGVSDFLFRSVCLNRTVFGLRDRQTHRLRHTAGAPERWREQLAPALREIAKGGTRGVADLARAAAAKRIAPNEAGDTVGEAVTAFLNKRFGVGEVAGIQDVHMTEEGRPIETLWDAHNGATAYARGITWQSDRVEVERRAGELLALAR